ncbi:MAG: choice-of-anchor X domain-containing protein [Dehalococcoidia bacterium]
MRRPSVIALIAITIVFFGSSLPATAAVPDEIPNGLTVIAIDAGAAPASNDINMAETAMATIASSVDEGVVTFVHYGTEPGDPVETVAGEEAADGARSAAAGLHGTAGPARSDQFAALTDVYSYMARVNAPEGSRVVLVTPGRIEGESEGTRGRLQGVGELYLTEGWHIDVAALPTMAAPLRELLSELAVASAGQFYDLGAAEGLSKLLLDRTGMELTTSIEAELTDGSQAAASVEVAPHADSLQAAFLRGGPGTEVTLFRPNGAAATSELTNVEVFETPNLVIFTVTGPQPGTWSLRGSGAASRLVAGVDVKNPLSLQLVEQPPLPVGQPGLLQAAAMIDDTPQALPGATIEARVRQPGGTAKVYELNDAGTGGDEVAGDGLFTTTLPELEAHGINDVALELSWANYGAIIRSEGTFKSELFPSVKVTRVSNIHATVGEAVPVAAVQVVVGDYPHLVGVEDVTAVLSGPSGESVAQVVARSEPEPGQAWEFEVLAAPPETGDYAILLTVASEYLGREFSVTSPDITTAATINPQPLQVMGLPIWAWAAAGVLIVALGGSYLHISRKVQPYGYLYDDQDRVVVDFARMRRSPLRHLMSMDRVNAREISGLPFHGGEFHFRRDGVELRYRRMEGDPSLRVNSRPAGPLVVLGDNIWLGVGGRLLTFVGERRASTMPAPMGVSVPAPADD